MAKRKDDYWTLAYENATKGQLDNKTTGAEIDSGFDTKWDAGSKIDSGFDTDFDAGFGINDVNTTNIDTGNNYNALGSYNDSGLGMGDAALVAYCQQEWQKAKAAGNQELMDYWHKTAEEARAKYGYSGGVDGSGYLPVTPSVMPTYNDNGRLASLDQMYNDIINRDPFSYDVESDPLYQQYKTMYNREGTRAMNDTLASVASGAGGMNSYAVTAASQANNYYASQLGDKIPELYQLAYEMYLTEGDNMVRDFQLGMNMEDMYYNRHRNDVADWLNNQYLDFDKEKWQTEFDYNKGEDSYSKAMELLMAGITPDAEMLKSANISDDMVAAILALQKKSGGTNPVTFDDGYSDDRTKTKTGRVLASEWENILYNIKYNLAQNNIANVENYLDQISGQLSKEQWNEIAALLTANGWKDVPTY